MISIGANELGEALKATITCPYCSKEHPVKNTDSKGDSNTLNYFICNSEAYLCGIDSQSIKHILDQ